MKKYLFTIATLCFSTVSCVEEWTLSSQGEDVSNVLNVVAHASLYNNTLSFNANTAQFSSGIAEIASYSQDSLILDLTVGDTTYPLRKSWSDRGENLGFCLNGINVPEGLRDISFMIHDPKGNFKDVCSQTVFSDKVRASFEVVPTKFSGKNGYPINYLDSLYTASITIHDPVDKNNYYMIAVEFLAWTGINSTRSYDAKRDHYDYIESIWKKAGYFPFSSSDPVFIDSDITSSVNGYDVGFSNVFDDDLFNGEDYTIRICFKNIFPYYYNENASYSEPVIDYERLLQFKTNAFTPFKIYLCSMTEEDYKYYKKLQHTACKKHSIFDEPASMPSNIQDGYGYFSTFNITEFFYFDGKIYW